MNRTGRFTAILLAVLAAGCTSISSGEPQPDDSSVTSGTGSANSPTRPREIKLDGIDPCILLPRADYGDYYLDKPGKPSKDDLGAANCAWYGEIGYMDVTLVTYEGIEAQEGRYGQIEPTDPIDDFPAYTVTVPGVEKACFTSVDVADGQYLDVQVGLFGSDPGNVPPVCEYAHQFASSVMSTLVKL